MIQLNSLLLTDVDFSGLVCRQLFNFSKVHVAEKMVGGVATLRIEQQGIAMVDWNRCSLHESRWESVSGDFMAWLVFLTSEPRGRRGDQIQSLTSSENPDGMCLLRNFWIMYENMKENGSPDRIWIA